MPPGRPAGAGNGNASVRRAVRMVAGRGAGEFERAYCSRRLLAAFVALLASSDRVGQSAGVGRLKPDRLSSPLNILGLPRCASAPRRSGDQLALAIARPLQARSVQGCAVGETVLLRGIPCRPGASRVWRTISSSSSQLVAVLDPRAALNGRSRGANRRHTMDYAARVRRTLWPPFFCGYTIRPLPLRQP